MITLHRTLVLNSELLFEWKPPQICLYLVSIALQISVVIFCFPALPPADLPYLYLMWKKKICIVSHFLVFHIEEWVRREEKLVVCVGTYRAVGDGKYISSSAPPEAVTQRQRLDLPWTAQGLALREFPEKGQIWFPWLISLRSPLSTIFSL